MMNKKRLNFYLKTFNVYLNYRLKNYIPFLVIIAPTNKCNLKCSYCTNVWRKEFSYLTFEQMLGVIDDCKKIGVPYVSFSGGEPMLHKDLGEIASYAQEKGIVTNLNTNGTLITKGWAEKIVNSFDTIRISLDGLQDMQDKICGVKGTYNRVVKNIERLMSIRNKKAKVGINFVVTEQNLSQVKEFTRIFKDKADFISLLPNFSFDQKKEQEISKVPNNLISVCKELSNDNKMANTYQFLNNPSLKYSKKICDAGKLYLSVWANSNVYSCFFHTRDQRMEKASLMGNIRNQRLIDIIKSKNVTSPNEICHGCHATCTTEISRIFRMNPIQLLNNANRLRRIYKI